MIDQLDRALRRLLNEARADAAVLWVLRTKPAGAAVLTSCPAGLMPAGTEWPVVDQLDPETMVRDPARLAAVVPTTLRLRLSAPPAAAQSFDLGHDLFLLVVWYDADVPDTVSDVLRHLIRNELSYLAGLVEDSRFNQGEADRLLATLNALQEGVVTVDPHLGQANVNDAAAALLHTPAGQIPAAEYAAAMAGLAARAINRDEADAAGAQLQRDPLAEIDCTWRFPEPPTHVRVRSVPLAQGAVTGRIWVLSDQSALSQALSDARQAQERLRASADAMQDPQVLLETVLDDRGVAVDLIYRDLNQTTCDYLGMAREELLNTSALDTLPNLEQSGLLARYAACAQTGQPLVLDDFAYHNEILDDARRYDIRATRVRPGVVNLTWRDVTERYAAARRIAESEEQFRLLAENSGDVVTRIREGRFIWVSPSIEKALGAPPQHWIGRKVLEMAPAGDEAEHLAVGRKVSAGEPVRTRLRAVGADGVTHWIHLQLQPFYDRGGRMDGATSSFRVIDDEVAAEEARDEARRRQATSDARYRRLMAGSNIGMTLITPDGRFDIVNQALCDFFGYDEATLRTKTWQQLTAADYLDADLGKVEDVLAGRIDSYRMTKQYIHADGHLIWGDLAVSCLRDERSHVERFVSQIADITAEMEARRQILQRDEQNRVLARRLQIQADRTKAELDSAAGYVASLLPGELTGPVRVTSAYLPSRELGGDCYGYSWVDDDHLVVYLIDVSGHGVAPALMSVSVLNMVRSGSLPRHTLLDPAALLAELNTHFQIERQGGNYFTMWYGVYHRPTRTLRYANAGHPPALVFPPDGPTARLSGGSPPVGMLEDVAFDAHEYEVPAGSRILLYSDGAFELPLPEERHGTLEEFVDLCTTQAAAPDWTLDRLSADLRSRTAGGQFEDDCSMILLQFG